ncbi:MAG: B12-binding domain-containing radical SAM protein [Nitrospirae bacterium]|nr:B12-binding domain-containing radical SAM protein [Nitrospirota bacterium]
MKVTLISPYFTLAAIGLRGISASLRKEGHQTRMAFLVPPSNESAHSYVYSKKLLDEVVSLCEGSDLIGISLMTSFFNHAVLITQAIKEKLPTPVIWGGIHPTLRPMECMKFADMVCVGEGEGASIELVGRMAEGKDLSGIENLWIKENGTIIENNNLEDHYIYDHSSEKLLLMDEKILEDYMVRELTLIPRTASFQIMGSRGCPYKCTYCCNNALQNLYKGQKPVRRRSVDNIIEETKIIKKRFPFITNVIFHDDTFFSANKEYIEDFGTRYKNEIGLPFGLLGDPTFTTEDKLQRMIEAGLKSVQIGLQSGSERILDIYKRKHHNKNMIPMGKMLSKYADRITIKYDSIIDNPYEEEKDLLDTIRVLREIPYPYELQVFSLVFFPGTELYEMAKSDNLIGDEREQIYQKYYFKMGTSYIHLLFTLLKANFPKPVIRMMTSKIMLSIFNHRVLNPFYFLCIKGINASIKIKRLVKKSLMG